MNKPPTTTETTFELAHRLHVDLERMAAAKIALRHLLTRVLTWTSNPWQQHLKNQFGEIVAAPAIAWIEENLTSTSLEKVLKARELVSLETARKMRYSSTYGKTDHSRRQPTLEKIFAHRKKAETDGAARIAWDFACAGYVDFLLEEFIHPDALQRAVNGERVEVLPAAPPSWQPKIDDRVTHQLSVACAAYGFGTVVGVPWPEWMRVRWDKMNITTFEHISNVARLKPVSEPPGESP